MNFKIDENLPADLIEDLSQAGHEADTVVGEGLSGVEDAKLVAAVNAEGRVLLTLDKNIANILSYPLETHAGVVLFRPGSMGRRAVLEFIRSRLEALLTVPIQNRITVVTEKGIRNRS